nr:HU family DNA-binding protein [Inmirania thermothiophila]
MAEKQTKAQVIAAIAEETGLTRAQVGAVFESLASLIHRHMKPRGSGEFTIPETGVRIRRVRRPATKARTGRNPRTGEPIQIPARPAQNVIRLTALKALKDALAKK